MKKAILFDMDGLMIDSKGNWTAAEKQLVEDYGKEFRMEIGKKYHGLRVNGMIKVMIREYGLPISQEEGEKKLKAYTKDNFRNKTLCLLPGCEALIKVLFQSSEYALAIASSSPKDIIEVAVKRLELINYFKALVSGEEVKDGKPASDIFLKAAELLRVEPQNCIVLEDAPNGIKAAKAGGMKAIAVSNNSHYTKKDFQNADLFVNSL